MLTPIEKTLVHVLTVLGVSESSIIGIMLTLKDNEEWQNKFAMFLRNSDPKLLTENAIVRTVRKLRTGEELEPLL